MSKSFEELAELHTNKKKQYQYAISVYLAAKQEDIPDTRIVSQVFPKHGIFIHRNTWVRIKSKKPSELQINQLSLF